MPTLKIAGIGSCGTDLITATVTRSKGRIQSRPLPVKPVLTRPTTPEEGNMTTDKYVRALTVCIECLGPKATGLVICWPCHRRLKARYSGTYGPILNDALDLIDEGFATVDNEGRLHYGQ
jgi:hypothetical protein